MRVSFKQKM